MNMEAKELGDIDGVQQWWCEDCQAMAPALKRNKAPEIKHAADCGKREAAPTPALVPIAGPDGETVKFAAPPAGASEQ